MSYLRKDLGGLLTIFPKTSVLRKLFLVVFVPFFFSISIIAQDSCRLKISLLTCSPGEELYSTFGHTALRVKDNTTGSDIIFNYGTFEFGPDFYTKFIKGQLHYFLSIENFADFASNYQYESRSIQEQVLQLSCAEKEKLFAALQTNAQEENKYYLYDFLFDNCTTRAKDIVAANTAFPVVFHNILPMDVLTFRNQIHYYLNKGGQYWSKLGIDLLLGAKLDKKVSNQQAMFLPDYLLKGFDSAIINGQPLVMPPQTILQMPSPLNKGSVFRPSIVFSFFLMIVIIFSFIQKKGLTKILYAFDFIFFLLAGLIGVLILFMWFGTDHNTTQKNYNILWALPTHALMAFFIHKKQNWIKKYFRIVMWLSILLLLAWAFLPQQMNNGFIPIVLLIIFRSWFISKREIYEAKRNTH
jgi:hypothetical protein